MPTWAPYRFFLGWDSPASLCLLLTLLAWAERIRQQAITAAAEERRRFLRRLDHELKNPLTAIRAGLANLAESPSGGARREALASVEAQALRLSRLSADLRKLAELEVRLVEHSPVDVPALLREAFSMAQEQPGAAERHLNLSIPQAPWPLPNVQGDPDLLLLAVHNLLENALKFSRPGDTWSCAPSRTARTSSSKWPTPVRASLKKSSRMYGRNSIAARPGAASRAAGWDWRSCGPSPNGIMAGSACAAALARGRFSPCACRPAKPHGPRLHGVDILCREIVISLPSLRNILIIK